MAEISLSYRRQGSQSATGRLADRLEAHFGSGRIFRDHESIAAGEDFAEAIRRAIEASTVVLVVIGLRWLDARDARGAATPDLAKAFDAIDTLPYRGVWVGLVLISGLIWLATLGWGFAAWGAYRQALGLDRARASRQRAVARAARCLVRAGPLADVIGSCAGAAQQTPERY